MRRAGALSLTVMVLIGCNSGPSSESASTTTWYSLAEKAGFIVDCLRSRGIEAEVHQEVGIMYDTRGQPEAAQRAMDECSTEVDAKYSDPPRLSMEALYKASLIGADCLRALGIDVPSAPTFGAFADSQSSNRWYPWDHIPLAMDFSDVNQKCPQPGLGLTPEGGT